jgi:hypothetical protein
VKIPEHKHTTKTTIPWKFFYDDREKFWSFKDFNDKFIFNPNDLTQKFAIPTTGSFYHSWDTNIISGFRYTKNFTNIEIRYSPSDKSFSRWIELSNIVSHHCLFVAEQLNVLLPFQINYSSTKKHVVRMNYGDIVYSCSVTSAPEYTEDDILPSENEADSGTIYQEADEEEEMSGTLVVSPTTEEKLHDLSLNDDQKEEINGPNTFPPLSDNILWDDEPLLQINSTPPLDNDQEMEHLITEEEKKLNALKHLRIEKRKRDEVLTEIQSMDAQLDQIKNQHQALYQQRTIKDQYRLNLEKEIQSKLESFKFRKF